MIDMVDVQYDPRKKFFARITELLERHRFVRVLNSRGAHSLRKRLYRAGIRAGVIADPVYPFVYIKRSEPEGEDTDDFGNSVQARR